MIKVIVLDFDDTLKVSEHLKQEGFVKVFDEIDGAVAVAQSYVQGHIGTPRYEMLKGILVELKGARVMDYFDLEQATADWVKKYGELLLGEVIAADEVPGAVEALKRLSGDFNLYVNSATPQSAIEKTVKKLGWRKYFKGVYGHPPSTKLDNLKKIIETEGVTPEEVVVVGDGSSDLEVAKTCGTNFIGVKGKFNKWPEKIDFPILEDLFGLTDLIKKKGENL